MWLTRVFLQRPTLVFVFVAVTLIAAVMALKSLVVQEQPNNGLPGITISVPYSGASTTELQSEVAEPIEDQLAGTPYLVSQSATIESGQVSISATFSLQSTDTENIANVEKALQAAQRQLPAAITAPTLRVADPSEPVVVSLALVSKKYSQGELGVIANNSIVPAIEQLAGVSNVNVSGTTQPAFMVTVDPSLLAAENLTLTDVVSSITPNNIRAPGGYVYQPGRETELDVRADLSTPQSVADLPIHVTYAGTTGANATGGPGAFYGGSSGSVADATVPALPSAGALEPAAPRVKQQAVRAGRPFGTADGTDAGSTAGGSVSSSGTTTQGATASVPVSTQGSSQSVSSSGSGIATSASAVSAAAQPAAGTSSFGSGSGTATSPFVGTLQSWAVPSSDKRISDVATVQSSTVVPRISASQTVTPASRSASRSRQAPARSRSPTRSSSPCLSSSGSFRMSSFRSRTFSRPSPNSRYKASSTR